MGSGFKAEHPRSRDNSLQPQYLQALYFYHHIYIGNILTIRSPTRKIPHSAPTISRTSPDSTEKPTHIT